MGGERAGAGLGRSKRVNTEEDAAPGEGGDAGDGACGRGKRGGANTDKEEKRQIMSGTILAWDGGGGMK